MRAAPSPPANLPDRYWRKGKSSVHSQYTCGASSAAKTVSATYGRGLAYQLRHGRSREIRNRLNSSTPEKYLPSIAAAANTPSATLQPSAAPGRAARKKQNAVHGHSDSSTVSALNLAARLA